VLAALAVSACGEPDFIGACAAECSCTADSFACKPPKSGGCDNLYRRGWVIAYQSTPSCQRQFEAYFECLRSKAVCTPKTATTSASWGPPAGACDTLRDAYNAC
jgi:hypothetical protein